MGKPLLLSLSLTLLLLFNVSLASRRNQQFQQQNECQIDNLDALEPFNRVEYEAGFVETWEPSHQQFQCAGVALARHTIHENGLLVPHFSNAPQLVYVAEGEGTVGLMIPGCPDTYQSPQQESSQQGSRGQQGQQDQHQKIRQFRKGDVIVVPPGIAHWWYNGGNTHVVTIHFIDILNEENQLDANPREFFLAGNPEDAFQQQQRRQPWWANKSLLGKGRRQQQSSCNNLFCGFSTQILADSFNVEPSLIEKIQGGDEEEENRGGIVKVQGKLQFISPPKSREEDDEGSRRNGIEETLCSLKLREHIGDPRRADIYTQGVGFISTLNSHVLPVLKWYELSMERGSLQSDAIFHPRWNLNSHCIMYGLEGSAQIQVVDNFGNSVFDGTLKEGQVLVVPQNFAVVKRAQGERFEWVAMKTNDNAMTAELTGRTSVIRAIPQEVLANAFGISNEEARRIKYSNQQTSLSSGRSSSRRAEA